MGFKPNTLFYTDGYKVGHKRMLAPGTVKLYGSWIPRSTKHAPKGITKIVSFGQQLAVKWLHDEFTENFFALENSAATKFGQDMSMYLGLPYDAKHFEELHALQYLPIKIKALPEGTETNPNIPHATFVNTVDGFAWLTLYLETILSSLMWKPSTSATIALQYRRNATEWVMKTDPTNSWLVDYMCHDFSARGLSPWDMLSSGLGNATSHRGSDSIICIPGARYFYNEPENEVCINSVNASEHSVSTTKIFTVGEKQMIIDWLKEFPTGILSIVADTFDLWKLLCEYLADSEVKSLVMARDGKLVIRPDSGDPVDIICGTNIEKVDSLEYAIGRLEDLVYSEASELTAGECGDYEYSDIFKIDNVIYRVTVYPEWNRHDKTYYYVDGFSNSKSEVITITPQQKGVIEILWDIYGGTTNEQGYKVLDSHIGAIYGDSITLDRQVQIYERLAAKGFAATNIVLGVGSFTYQYNTRDTLGFAAKGAWFEIQPKCECSETEAIECSKNTPDGSGKCNYKQYYNIYKDPITDDGTKKSLKGLLCVSQDDNNEIVCLQECNAIQESKGLLQVIYEDGKFYNQTTLTEIRNKLLNQ